MTVRAAATRLLDAALRLVRRPDERTETLPGIRLHERSIRALLVRIPPLACERTGEGRVSVPVFDAIDAVEARRCAPIHQAVPNRAAGAPRSDARALRALAAELRRTYLADRDANKRIDYCLAIELAVPDPVSRWIDLRARRVERTLDAMWSDAA